MSFFKRIFLFLFINMLVIATISIILSVFNVRPYLTPYGLDYQALMIFCLIWGMVGAFISLAMSRIMVKWMMHIHVIDPNTSNSNEQWLYQTVKNLSKAAGLSTVPEIGIYDSPEVNAFATGPTKSRSLVTVSTGLLQRMDQNAIEGVLGHEISHIANGDMVTMTLIQGIVNAFVMFLARVIAYAIVTAMRSKDSRWIFYLITFALEIVLMFLGMLVVAWFSRWREFRADAGGARVAGREKMVQALQALQRTIELQDPKTEKPALQALKISTKERGIFRLFSTHPPLAERIRRLQIS